MPEPYPSDQAPDSLPPCIRSLVELSNLRLFKDTPLVDAPFPDPGPDHGQWIVLGGENGTGKTVLLRAIGLALADPTVATRLLNERLPFVRNGGEGRIVVDLHRAAGSAGGIELHQQDIQPGHEVDRVLFEQFGIEYTFDKQTRELLRRHREMLEQGVRADDAERARLEAELTIRLGRVGEVLLDERGHIEDPTRRWDESDLIAGSMTDPSRT